jgi:hypothetical protein
MRGILLILLMLACVADSADARRRHHSRYYYDAVTPAETGRPYSSPQSQPTPAPDRSSERAQSRMVPAGWREEPADPQLKGQRFVSPDGNASFSAYTVATGEEGIAAHLKAVAFADGEQITYLRGERTWIAVAGFKQDRIFYRAAVLACGGDRWHQIAFEYPASAKAEMRNYVERASEAVRGSDNSWCDVPVSNQLPVTSNQQSESPPLSGH